MIEDVYPLTPLQEGMLFHSLRASGSGPYTVQLQFSLPADLDVPAFARAWSEVTARHAVMRTSFHWEGLEESVQVVHREVRIPIIQLD